MYYIIFRPGEKKLPIGPGYIRGPRNLGLLNFFKLKKQLIRRIRRTKWKKLTPYSYLTELNSRTLSQVIENSVRGPPRYQVPRTRVSHPHDTVYIICV